jgi:hypothetical protein
MNDEIFESYKPELAERFKRNVHKTFSEMVEDLGPELKGVYNSWSWAKTFTSVVQPFCKGYKRGEAKALNEDRITAAAEKYADMVVESWKTKIDEKIGMMDSATVHHLDGCRFSITGTKAGQEVYITQDMIINISSQGTLFNQFPARIKLDGKAISAAKFKKHFAA